MSQQYTEQPNPIRAIVQPLVDFARSPRAMWGINVPFFMEGFVYFGMLGYMAMYFNEFIGLPETEAGWMLGFLTAGITISQLFFGGFADKYGVRRTLTAALLFMIVGRVIIAATPATGFSTEGAINGLLSPLNLMAAGGILFVVLGYGTWQPATYSAVRQLTTPKTAAMGYAMLYAFMNLGGWLPSFFSPVRKAIGIDGSYWVYVGITITTLFILLSLLTHRAMKNAILAANQKEEAATPDGPSQDAAKENDILDASAAPASRATFRERLKEKLCNHPLADARFSFFIFALIPVQTLFAHNWLTLPQYVERAFRGTPIGDNFEVAVNLNPLLIFLLVPIVTALTHRQKIYKMMLVGTFVMATPTFLLALSPHPVLLFSYLLIMTIGEAMWQPRFLQYAAEIAPEGRTGAYMGVAQLPWFLTKMVTAAYAGYFIATFCPNEGPLNTEFMWLIHATIAMGSFVLLFAARKWMMAGMKEKAA